MKLSFVKLLPILFLLSFLLDSCKKKPNTTKYTDYSHFEANYYCQGITYNYYNDERSDTFDIVLSIGLNNGNLEVFTFGSFPVTSSDQTSFEDNYTVGPVGSPRSQIKTVSFSNDYNNISLTLSTNDGSRRENKYRGTKTNLQASFPANFHLESLGGAYLLNIRKLDLQGGLDTTYTSIVSVNKQPEGIEIDGKIFEFSNFYSNARHNNKLSFLTRGENSGSAYWGNDSLNLTYHIERDSVPGVPGTSPADCYYYFSGVKN